MSLNWTIKSSEQSSSLSVLAFAQLDRMTLALITVYSIVKHYRDTPAEQTKQNTRNNISTLKTADTIKLFDWFTRQLFLESLTSTTLKSV